MKQSGCRTRIDYLTALIEKEHKALSGHNALPGNRPSPAPAGDTASLPRNVPKKAVSHRRPAQKKPGKPPRKPIELWHNEQRF